MPKGVITVAVFYGALATLCLIDVLTLLHGRPPSQTAIYIFILFYLSAMVVSALTRHKIAWWVFIVLQVVLALLEIVVGAVFLARGETGAGLFYLGSVCIYGVIIWYFMWPEIKEFYGVKRKPEQTPE